MRRSVAKICWIYCRASCLMIFSFGWFFCSFPFFVLEPGGCKTFTLQTFDTGEACCMRHKPSSIYLQSNCLFMAPIPSKPRHSCTFPSCNVFLPAQDSKPPPLARPTTQSLDRSVARCRNCGPATACEAPRARFRRKDCFTGFVIPPTTSYLLVDV